MRLKLNAALVGLTETDFRELLRAKGFENPANLRYLPGNPRYWKCEVTYAGLRGTVRQSFNDGALLFSVLVPYEQSPSNSAT